MSFTVTVTPSGYQFEVEPGEVLLDAALRQGIEIPYGCGEGSCGACLAPLISGEVSYPGNEFPSALDDDSDGHCLPCTAMVESNLTIEIEELQSKNKVKKEETEIDTIPCRVEKIEHLTSNVMRLILQLPKDQELNFTAGQYLKLFLKDGTYRNFSIANAPHRKEYVELHIKNFGGSEFMKWIFEDMSEKSVLKIEAPYGNLSLNEKSNRPLLMIGGGTGFAPLKSIIEYALEMGFNREIFLFWGAISEEELYLSELPEAWSKQYENFHYIPVLSSPVDSWPGKSGWVHEIVLHDIKNLSDFDIYMAGPPAMLRAAKESLLCEDISEDQLHYDPFEFS